MRWFKREPDKVVPEPGERAEALKHPGGRVYRIKGTYDPDGAVPPEAIVGAWKVDEAGRIYGDFIPNPNFQP